MVIEILAGLIIFGVMYMGLAKIRDLEWDKSTKKFKDWTKDERWETNSLRNIQKPWWDE